MATQYNRPLTIDTSTASSSQFVGRQRELTSLWNQYKAAKEGSVRVVLLVGELGIGKTHLLDEIAIRVVRDRAIVLRGGASDSEGMPPYLPFLEALGQHIHVTPPDQLRRQVAVAPKILMSILPELSAHLGELSDPYPPPPEQKRLRLYEAMAAFLKVISIPHGLVLILDDLHLADSASLDLLCYITRHLPDARLLILGAYREGEVDRVAGLERCVTELARQRVLTQVAVEAFSPTEIEALAADYLGGAVDPAVNQLLYRHSEGNPFFAEEIIRSWIEMNVLIQENDHWLAGIPLDHALPPSIAGALRQRFAKLPTKIIDHLRIAAIIGRTVDPYLLAAVEGQEFELVEECLLEAERARLVRVDHEGLFSFSHEKIREILYAEVSTAKRRRLHEAIGRLLEAQYDQKSTKSTYQLAELAFHFAQSGDRERGFIYSQLTAEQALRSSAVEEAMHHYRTALELLDTDDKRQGGLLLGLGEAAMAAGAENEAVAAFEKARGWLLEAGELEAAARAAHKLGLAQWRREALQEAQAALERSLALLGDCPSEEAARVLGDLAILLTNCMGQQAEGTAYAQRALEMADHLGINHLVAAATQAVAGTLFTPGKDIAQALQTTEQALELAEAGDHPAAMSECSFYLAGAYYCTAEIRRSFEVSLHRLELLGHYRDLYALRNTYTWLALLHCSQGAWVEAEQAIDQALKTVNRSSDHTSLTFLSHIRGFLVYQRDDYVTAEREFQAALVDWQKSPYWLRCSSGLPGMALVALGKREEANDYMTELEGLLDELPAGALLTAPILLCLALMALSLDDRKRATNLYSRLLDFSGQHYWFLVDRVLAMIASSSGDWEVARMHLATAEATAQREGLRPELARILLAWADYELARGEQGSVARATDYLKQALTLFEEMGMVDAAHRVRRWLRTPLYRLQSPYRRSLPADLTEREAEVLQLVVRGKSNRQIAQELGLSEKTVANHLTHVFSKTKSENRAAATAFAIHHGLA